MPASQALADFIRSHFLSVWSLELLLHLRNHPATSWSGTELVDALRASQAVVSTSVEGLLAGGLIVLEEDGRARYGPASRDLQERVDETARLYATKPDTVRRLIVLAGRGGVEAFADAFRLRRE
jgi:hypothetical protein